jgi:hypothetical protein
VSQIRTNFLNWQPDAEDVGNDGLSQADNVLHDTEGYKPVHLGSSTAFSTVIAASAATVLSIVAKPVGAQGDLFCAWLSGASTPALNVGINGETATSSATGYPPSFAVAVTDPAIWAFDVAEYGGKICWTVEARGADASASAVSVAFAGLMDY